MDILVSFVVVLTILEAGHGKLMTDPNCIIDPTLDASVADNYLNCQTEEMVNAGTTSCCYKDNVKSCCQEGKESWDMMIIIGCAIGGVTTVLVIFVFCVMWCLRDIVPCFGYCMKFTQKKYYEVEESFCCCEGRVMKRRQEQEMMKKSKKKPVLALPEEKTENTKKEDCWQGKLIES
ncbi:uncharacterized protein LOC132565644 [Ylistrum balloti]|uniref:uncharacterized protein LOC132565644 n=1 Tax=Ylistrum balloti TaxID=509963 RepID=UPI002905AFF2|nr:uncharacterized protein LOC132565644 [Ylistrum balloti]